MVRPLHVLMITRSFQADGPGRLLFGLMRAWRPEEIRLSLVVLDRDGPLKKNFTEEARRLGGELHCEPAGWLGIRVAGDRIGEMALDNGVDMLHANLLRADVAARRAARRAGLPCLVTEHGLHGWSEAGRMLRPVVRRWYLGSRWEGLHIAAISQMVARQLRAEGVPGRQITVIPNGIDPGEFPIASEGQRQEARECLDIPANAYPVILQLGNLIPRKSPELSLKVHHLLRERGWKDARLLFAGEGRLRRRLERKAGGGGVHFAGRMEEPLLAVHAADVLLHPAKSEPFGLAVAEALVAGLPAVVRAGTGAHEILPPGEICAAVEGDRAGHWADALELRLAEAGPEPDVRSFLRGHVESCFSIRKTARRYLRLYERLPDRDAN